MKDMFTEKISLWLDNELSPAERIELQDHLAGCPTCRQTYETMQQIDRLFQSAATQMVAPPPGFTQRFELRLAHYTPRRPWQIWLALGALLIGTLFVFGTWAIIGGIALLGLSTTALDAGLLYQWLITLIESVDNLRVFLNLGALLLKASYITMKEPLFWGCLIIAMSLTGLWVRAMQIIHRRATTTLQLIL